MTDAYLKNLQTVADDDVKALKKAHESYGNSCLRRGGVGLFMMFARKWDRLENQVQKVGYDIFKAYENDKRVEGVLDDVRDLRRYLCILEAELMCRYHNDFVKLDTPNDVVMAVSDAGHIVMDEVTTIADMGHVRIQDQPPVDDRQGVEPQGRGYVDQDRQPGLSKQAREFPHLTTTTVMEKYGCKFALWEEPAVDGTAYRFWDMFYHAGLEMVMTADELPPGERQLQKYRIKKAG